MTPTDGHGSQTPSGDTRFQRRQVATPSGEFCVGEWVGSSSPVLALHGISSNHLLWSWAADADPQLHILAPDLRGRGGSTHDGPYGLEQHRDDMLALMDALGLHHVTLAGMSLGAFVAVAMAATAPDRFTSVLLVDGGLAMSMDEAARESVMGAVSSRCAAGEVFTDIDSYVEHYLAEFGPDLDRKDPVMRAFLGWNLRQGGADLTVSMPVDAIARDAADVFFDAPVAAWLSAARVPMHLLRADATDIVPEDQVDAWLAGGPDRTAEVVPDTNHATIAMGDRGGLITGAALRHAVEAHAAT